MIHVLHLGLSYACNMKCRHCFVERNNDSLTNEKAKQILDILYNRGLFIVYYTFGEPLLARDLIEVISHGKRLGLVQVLMTNGYTLTIEKAKELKDNGITNVCISLDSICPEKHDFNRGLNGAYEHALNAIDCSVAAGIRTGIGCTVMEQNMNELQQIETLAQQRGVSYVSFLRERKQNLLQTKNNKYYYDYAKDCFLNPEQHMSVLFHDKTLNPIIRKLYSERAIGQERCDKLCEMNACHSSYTLAIAPNGLVSHCNLCFHVIGNIHNDDLDTILNKESRIHEHPVCCS